MEASRPLQSLEIKDCCCTSAAACNMHVATFYECVNPTSNQPTMVCLSTFTLPAEIIRRTVRGKENSNFCQQLALPLRGVIAVAQNYARLFELQACMALSDYRSSELSVASFSANLEEMSLKGNVLTFPTSR